MSGSENAGLVAAETKNPRRSVPKAVASIWIRLSLFYILGSLIITINVSPLNEDIFGGSGTNASPFVIMYRQAGVQPLAHMMNAVIFISVLSTGTISGFAGARTLLGLSQIGMAPRVSLWKDFFQLHAPLLTQYPANAKSRQERSTMVRPRPNPRHRRRPSLPKRLIR